MTKKYYVLTNGKDVLKGSWFTPQQLQIALKAQTVPNDYQWRLIETTTPGPVYQSTTDVAQDTGLSERTIRRWCARLGYPKVGKTYVLTAHLVAELKNQFPSAARS